MTRTYFNEIDRVACAVLRECHVGVVDERSIKEVLPDDVRGYERAHFFAGAGLWEIAADMAGWRRPLWTASCPCQPFSVAGKGAGRDDPRHLWPDIFRLARAVRPPVIVGEQVAGSAGFDWFDGVASDLEGEGYACRAVDIPACAVDAPHRRQRLYWVAVAHTNGRNAGAEWQQLRREQRLHPQAGGHSGAARDAERVEVALADADGRGRGGRPEDALGRAGRRDAAERSSFWSGAEWLQCVDGKARRTKPGIRLLVDGMAGRADLWRLAGNSIVPQVAAQVLAALDEALRSA